MAINKEKNVIIAITFPKEDASNLQTLMEAFNKNGIKVSKSEILLQAFKDYLKILIIAGTKDKKEEEPQEEKHNA